MTKFCIWTPDGQGGVKQEIVNGGSIKVTPSKTGMIIKIGKRTILNAVGAVEITPNIEVK